MDFEGAFFDTTDYEPTNKKIGEGAFGKVYIVEKESTNEQFAAKIINSEGELDGHDQMMLLRESLILHKLKHPSIVKFIGINLHSFDNPDKLEPTIITEYLSHGSLKDILTKEQNCIADDNWSPTKKYICLLGIADAMRYLHQHGIIHRDLKPENILVDENYYPRICDFGLSKCFSFMLSKSVQLSMTGKIGTPLYMAPELMMDEEKYGPGIDVYAFAILAYEIVSGKEPFAVRGKPIKLVELGKKVMSGGRPEFTDGITEKMKDLITQCWSQDYKNRPSFDEIFKKLSEDLSYFEEDVDEDEIEEYLETLKEETELIPPMPTVEEIQKLKSKNDELEKTINAKDDEIQNLIKENAQLKKDNEKANNDIKKLSNENAQLKKDNEKANNDIKKLSSDNAQLKKDNEKANNDIKKLSSDNAQLKKDNEKANNDIKKLTSDNAQLKKDSEKAKNDIKKISTKNEEVKKDKDEDKNDAKKEVPTPAPETSKISKLPKVKSSTASIDYDNVVIIDNGSASIKACFNGDDDPRSVFPSVVGKPKYITSPAYRDLRFVGDDTYAKAGVLILKYPIEKGIVTSWDDMEEIWKHTFNKELKIDPSDHPIVITESLSNPKANREKTAQIMFETFNVPAYFSGSQEIFSVFSTGRTSGLSCSIGKDSYQCISIFECYTIPHSFNKVDIGGNNLTSYLQIMLNERGYMFTTLAERLIVEDIKEKHCYVALDYNTELTKAKSSSELDASYTLPDGNVITIADERFRIPELLFQPKMKDLNYQGIDKIIVDSINKCDSDLHSTLFNNIVLSGGSSMFEGLPERVENDITKLSPKGQKVKIIAPPERKYGAMIGASIFASLAIFPQQVCTRDEYNDYGPGCVHHRFLL